MGYTILKEGKAIQCGICKLTSHHPKDVENLYCNNCKVYHEDLSLLRAHHCPSNYRSLLKEAVKVLEITGGRDATDILFDISHLNLTK